MIFALLVFASMAIMDAAAALKIMLLTHSHPWLAGAAEAANDYGGIFSYGIGGAAMFRYGVSATTAVILLALGCASVLGTRLGAYLDERWRC